MRKFLFLLLGPLLLSGCIVYGKGETVGYVYAVDDGFFWHKIYFRTDLQSSQDDCYIVNDSSLVKQLQDVSGKSKVRLEYRRHLFTLSDNCNDDEITSVEQL